MDLTKRVGFDIGLICNANCRFCYYLDFQIKKNPSSETLEKRLRLARRLGMESVEFTGGEPTMREDIFELVFYAKRLGFKRICMITNGILLADKEITQKAEMAGLDEIKLSIHSSKANVHDKITGVKNSFKQLMKGVENIKKTSIKLKTNTIINRLNYKHLPEIANFLITIKPKRINLKFVTPIIGAKSLGKRVIVKYSEAEPYLHESLDILKLKGYNPTVRYIPFCFMKDYESNVCNLCQVQYDPDEWDYIAKNRIEYGLILSEASKLFGYVNMFKRGYFPKKDFAHRAVIESKLVRFTTKRKACRQCKYDFICDGLWKDYARLYGYSELKPLISKKIMEPYYFLIK